MPELPEVETIKRQLARRVIGRKIVSAEAYLPKAVNFPPAVFCRKLKGKAIEGVARRAKVIIIKLKGQDDLLVHLRMSGYLNYLSEKTANPDYAHVVLHLDNAHKLVFGDFRKFGFMKYFPDKGVEAELEKFGPEPLAPSYVLKRFEADILRKPKARIKQWLMDPQNLAGIGNIYAAEICFAAGVRPDRAIETLSAKEIRKLFSGMKRILARAVKEHGTSASNYFDLYGRPGNYVPYLKVYGRAGKPCRKCGTEVTRMKLGGRGTYYCKTCQK